MEDKKKEEELIQEETAVQPEESGEEKEEQTETHQGGLPMRSCVLMLLAGLYLLYTGYKLCQNVLNGVEGGNWGFFAAGVGFLIVGAVMLFIAGKNYLRREKEKKGQGWPRIFPTGRKKKQKRTGRVQKKRYRMLPAKTLQNKKAADVHLRTSAVFF